MSTTYRDYVQDYGAAERFECRDPDLRDEIQIMAEANRWNGLAADAPRPSFLARLWSRRAPATRLAA